MSTADLVEGVRIINTLASGRVRNGVLGGQVVNCPNCIDDDIIFAARL
jgi:hypothetical protein